jgi:hypothetical protein
MKPNVLIAARSDIPWQEIFEEKVGKLLIAHSLEDALKLIDNDYHLALIDVDLSGNENGDLDLRGEANGIALARKIREAKEDATRIVIFFKNFRVYGHYISGPYYLEIFDNYHTYPLTTNEVYYEIEVTRTSQK